MGLREKRVSVVGSCGQGVGEDQRRIANAVGTSVGYLFGDGAWFRVAARKLVEARRAAG